MVEWVNWTNPNGTNRCVQHQTRDVLVQTRLLSEWEESLKWSWPWAFNTFVLTKLETIRSNLEFEQRPFVSGMPEGRKSAQLILKTTWPIGPPVHPKCSDSKSFHKCYLSVIWVFQQEESLRPTCLLVPAEINMNKISSVKVFVCWLLFTAALRNIPAIRQRSLNNLACLNI